MIGETVQEVLTVPGAKRDEWPDFYVVTNRCAYHYTCDAFTRVERVPPGQSLVIPAVDKSVSGVFGDGEAAVIVLSGGDAIVFGLDHDPQDACSWPSVDFEPGEKFRIWSKALADMEKWFP